MSNHRTLGLGFAIAVSALAASASGSDFSDRMAAWQNGPPVAGATAPPTVAAEAAAPIPSPAPQAAVAGAPQNYGYGYGYGPSPGIMSNCACGNGPRFVGPSCDGVNGCCGRFGCGPLGCGGPWGNMFGGGMLGGGGACHACGDSCDSSPWCSNTLVWARFDVLLWWRQGRDLPPLVTTDPVNESSTTAGILPDATTLFGGGRVGSNMQVGGRFDVGFWADPRQCWGLGWRFFGLGQDSTNFAINSLKNPVLAIPFTDAGTGTNDALLVAYPGLRTGSIAVTGTSEILGNDLYGRFLICRDCNSRLDFLTGWNYTRVNDSVSIRSNSMVTEVGGNVPVGTVTDIRDDFRARNQFNGAILGLMYEQNCCCWNFQVMGRMSVGSMFEETSIRGSTHIASPGLPPQDANTGLFAADTNSGTSSRNEFTAITELGARIGYRIAPCTLISVGYTFIYWNDVVTAGRAIDTNIGSGDSGDHPQFAFRHSDYWVQGLNLGFTREF